MKRARASKSDTETRGSVTITAGKITKNGVAIGTVMHGLECGYHPVVRLRLDGKPLKTFEVDTTDLLDQVFALANAYEP